MTLRTAILWCSLLGGLAPAVRGQADLPGRTLPLPPIAPLPVPVAPAERSTVPPPRPGLSTSFQLPKDGRSPFETPGPVLPERPQDPLRPPPATDIPVGGRVALPSGGQQVIRFGPRYGQLNTAKSEPVPNDDDPSKKETQRVTYQGGLVIHIEYLQTDTEVRQVELAADHVVMWVKGVKSDFSLNDTLRVDPGKKVDGERSDAEKKDEKVKVQMYLGGNVVIRTRSDQTTQGVQEQVFRAAEIFYDVDDSRALAVQADLETKFPQGFDALHLRAPEIHQLGRHDIRAFDAVTFSSKRPADPALTINSRNVTLTENVVERRNVFGRPFRDLLTGQPDVGTERLLVGEESVVRILGFPVWRNRRTTTDLSDPTGTVSALSFRSDRVYGQFQVYSSFDAYELLGLRPPKGNSWVVHADYLSLRGPGTGTDYLYRDLFGPAYRNTGAVSGYLLYDRADQDILGAFRGPEPRRSDLRGWFEWTHNQDLFEVGTAFTRLHAQFAYLSDKNFFEQFYKLRYDQDPNPETFLYLYGGNGNFAWSGLTQVNVNRPWVSETQWLPRLDAALIGESFFDTLVSTTRASAGYALLRPATQGAQPTQPGEQRAVDTVRGEVYERLSLPFDLGPVRLEPYAIGSAVGYSADATGKSNGRLYGGGGLTAGIPFSRLYPEVRSDLLNLRGLHHKVELRANYLIAGSDTDHRELPLLDRLNDDVSDYSYRAWRRTGGLFTANNGQLFKDTPAGIALATSPIFDPQQLANRRLLQSRAEVLDDMQAVQMEVRQRWQTKRGPPGADHTVDVMAFNVRGTYFPDRNRDNFGESFGLLEYDWIWNIGDRTAVTSSGWFDPFGQGTRYVNLGVYYNRPDGSNFYLGYRHTDPISSRLLVAVLGYQFSKKYSVSLSNVFDLSTSFSQGATLAFNRTGTDLTMSLGVSYNSFQNNFGVQFLIVPNAALYGRPQSFGNLFN